MCSIDKLLVSSPEILLLDRPFFPFWYKWYNFISNCYCFRSRGSKFLSTCTELDNEAICFVINHYNIILWTVILSCTSHEYCCIFLSRFWRMSIIHKTDCLSVNILCYNKYLQWNLFLLYAFFFLGKWANKTANKTTPTFRKQTS